MLCFTQWCGFLFAGPFSTAVVEKAYIGAHVAASYISNSGSDSINAPTSTVGSSSSRAAALSAYSDPAAMIKGELERVGEYMPQQAQQLALVEDLLCRMLVVDPEQRPAAADLLGHPFFELGRASRRDPISCVTQHS
jgi:serine/threonine protein kinase